MIVYAYVTFKKDLRGEITKIARFVGKNLGEEKLSQLVAHLRFDNFAKNESVNVEIGKELGFMNNTGNFIRKGTYIAHSFEVENHEKVQ